MAIDPQWIIGAVIVAAVLVVALLFMRGARKSRSAALQDKFGREYDHAVRQSGSRSKAESDLIARAEEVKSFDIQPLSAADRERFQSDWQRIERHFLERPAMAVAEADELVADIMRVQGYPMGDFDKHAAHLSVTHPRVVEHYRAGHKVMTGAPGSASTEDMRQSMLHYRELYSELVSQAVGPRDMERDLPRQNEVITSPAPRRDRDGDRRDQGVKGDDLFRRR